MFQPARPPLMWSSEANLRATWKGSLYVVDAVAISPMWSVTAARAASSVSGSSPPSALCRTLPSRARPSARNTESSLPRSAIVASSWKWRRSVTWRGSVSGMPPGRLVVADAHEEGVQMHGHVVLQVEKRRSRRTRSRLNSRPSAEIVMIPAYMSGTRKLYCA